MGYDAQRLATIRVIAQRLWELEGRPEGRAEVHWQQAEMIQAEQETQARQIVYVLDQDLVRFLKFSAGIITLLLTAGAILWGVDLKQTSKEVETVRRSIEADRKLMEEARKATADILKEAKQLESDTKAAVIAGRSEIEGAVRQAQKNLDEIAKNVSESQKFVTSQGLVVDVVKLEIRRQVEIQLTSQVAFVGASKEAINTLRSNYKKEEVEPSIRSDIQKAVAFLRQHGLSPPNISVEFKGDSYNNTAYDGRKIIFGMGMVNGPIFGPYDPTVIYHEVTHSVFNISFNGQSGSVAESICDVFAVLIDGDTWAVGRVRGDNPSVTQNIRSLSAPGTAYNQPVLGKDPQPDHMSGFVSTESDLGGVYTNTGILNKAAYLMSEGGTHHSVVVARGLGREKLAQLYAEVIKALPKNKATDFAAFKALAIATANRLFPDPTDRATVAQSFTAVGL